MTEQLPRPIFARDIQVGDRVRATDQVGNDIRTVTFIVYAVKPGLLDSLDSRYTTDGEWTLLDRPEPTREVGSRWRDPETGYEYVRTDGTGNGVAHYRIYRGLTFTPSDDLLIPDYGTDQHVIARLTALDGV